MNKPITYYLLVAGIFCNAVFANAQNLTQAEKNTIVLTKMIGIVQYFYPSENIKKLDWNSFTRYALSDTEKLKNNASLRDSLNALFHKFAPSLNVLLTAENKPQVKTAAKVNYPKKCYAWQHKGYGFDRDQYSLITKGFIPWKSTLIQIKNGKQSQALPLVDSLYTFALNDSLLLSMPLCMSKIEKIKDKAIFKRGDDLYSDKRLEQLSVLIDIWNVMQHFYIYIQHTDCNWDLFLQKMLTKINKGLSTKDFEILMYNSLRELNDRHIQFFKRQKNDISVSRNKYEVPTIELTWAENQVVVSKIYDDRLPLKRGDVISKISGKTINEIFNKRNSLFKSVSPKFKKLIAQKLLYPLVEQEVEFEIIRDSKPEIYTVELSKKAITKKALYEVEKGYYYIDFSFVSKSQIKELLAELQNAKGIIADSRYRTGVAFEYFISLIIGDKTVESGNWFTPIISYPNRKGVEYEKLTAWHIKPDKKHKINAKIVFLSGNNCFSRGETNLDIIKHYKLGKIIGNSTAGTNGDVAYAYIDKKYVLIFTQLLVLNRDGSVLFGKGIQPDEVVVPTIEQIKNSDDFMLDYALEYLKK